MRNYYCKAILVLVFTMLLVSTVFASNQDAMSLIELEEQGIDLINQVEIDGQLKSNGGNLALTDSLPNQDVLLIPNSTDDSIVMFDPFTGDSIGVFVIDPTHLSTPICAMEGPDGNIYVSDQVEDGVIVYD